MAGQLPYLDIQNLTKSFGAHLLFQDISFSVAEGQKIGLVAKNGTGKSTLLSILTGHEGYDSGNIVFRRDLKIGYLEQSPKFDPDDTVLDACFNHKGDEAKILRAKQILTQLKIDDLDKKIGTLSGGQQRRVALANVLLTEPDMFILDEPTNHLDLDMIEWLEGFLPAATKRCSWLLTTDTSLIRFALSYSNLTTRKYTPTAATTAIISKNDRNVSTIHVPK